VEKLALAGSSYDGLVLDSCRAAAWVAGLNGGYGHECVSTVLGPRLF